MSAPYAGKRRMNVLPKALLLCCALFAGRPLSAANQSRGDREFERAPLRGLRSFHVVVEDLDPEAAGVGLNRDGLQTDVEVKFRTTGLPLRDGTSPYYYVRLTFLDLGSVVTWYVTAELREEVFLPREPPLRRVAAIWSAGQIGSVGRARVVEMIRQTVRDVTDKFINDYLAANPKR